MTFGAMLGCAGISSGQTTPPAQPAPVKMKAHAAVLARQIQTEIQGAREVLIIRREALASY